jgi:uncharacterized protein YfcZ (UPF0381/DUF406 family)
LRKFRISIGDAPATYTIQAGTVINPAGLEYTIVATPGDSYLQVKFRPAVTYGNEFSIELLLKNSTGATVGTNVSQTVYGDYQSFLPVCTPVNCVVSDWSAWSTCNGGTQSRTRTIITQPSGGGQACPTLTETRDCPVDCVVSAWSDWSTCSEGLQSRTRTVVTPAINGGAACPVLSETRTCSSIGIGSTICNTDGGSTITKRFAISIGNAPSTYTIVAGTVSNPAGLEYSINSTPGSSYLQVTFRPSVTYGGEFSIDLILKNPSGITVGSSGLQTVYSTYQSFLPGCYPVNCVVSDWSAWSACIDGVETRTRTIITQPSGGGNPCPPLTETRGCYVPPTSYAFTLSNSASYDFSYACTFLDMGLTLYGSESSIFSNQYLYSDSGLTSLFDGESKFRRYEGFGFANTIAIGSNGEIITYENC